MFLNTRALDCIFINIKHLLDVIFLKKLSKPEFDLHFQVLDQWDRIWSYSSFYVERLKTVEVTLTGLEEATSVVADFEMKLSAYESMPGDLDSLRKAQDELMELEADIQNNQEVVDRLQVLYTFLGGKICF